MTNVLSGKTHQNHDLGLVLDKLNPYRENFRPLYDEIPKMCGYVAQLVRAQHS